jgi:alpha-L-arabinofuranosidase
MASQNHLPLLVECNVDGAASQLDVTATRSEDGNKMVLHIANIGEKAVDAEFDLSGFGNVGEAYTLTLSAPLKDVNSPDNPTKIVPVKRALDSGEKLACKISEYSYTVLVVSK